MLAAWTDALAIWQLFVIVPLILLWLIGGGWMIGVSIRRLTEARRFHPVQGIIATLLATLAGGFAVGVVMMICSTLGGALKAGGQAVAVTGGVIGGIIGLLVMFLVFYAMFKATAKQVLRAIGPPTLGVLVLSGALGGILYKPIITKSRETQWLKICGWQLDMIREALQRRYTELGVPPATLVDIVIGVDNGERYIQCPGNRENPVGYVYMPYTSMVPVENRLILADRKGNHAEVVHVIVFAAIIRNGRLEQTVQRQSLPVEAFHKLLAEPVNESFAKEYNK